MTELDDDLLAIDETLGDLSVDALPVGASGRAVARHRWMHGMLRVMATADSEATEARVRQIMQSVAERPRTKVFTLRRVSVAAASVIAVAIGIYVLRPMPQHLQAMQIAGAAMNEPVHRRFEVSVRSGMVGEPLEDCGRLHVTVHPGGYFVWDFLEGEMAPCRLGRPGTGRPIWFEPRQKTSLQAILAKMRGGLIDVGYLDLGRVLDFIPGSENLVSMSSHRTDSGPEMITVEGDYLAPFMFGGLEHAELQVDCDHQKVMSLELHILLPLGLRRQVVRFEELGEADVGFAAYEPPR